ncbi:unnamed protein product [Heligmosomoides polygyrus]|uniref:Rapamycin-insensitive companion of mTOR n=1 Tax=Heligmosomoides polygyrus TaxID=6339 RepID=A0A3P8AL88_HELPZ|nr:unnamed protein product [Heligmosomoides polygyrus]
MLKRPEESIQNAIISYSGLLFDTLGPRMRSQHSEKAYELYCAAAENLEISGTANRAGVTVIAQLAMYYPSVMNKAFLRCMVNVREADDTVNRTRLIGSLNTLKTIWSLLSEPGYAVSQDNIKMVICSVLCCLYSAYSEVVVPSIELLEKIMTNPLPWIREFIPLKFDITPSFRSKLSSVDRPSRTASPVRAEESRPSSSLGSMFDVTESTDGISDFNVPLQLPERAQSGPSSSSGSSSPAVEDEIIDPLLHADLYEEVTKCDRYVVDLNSSLLSNSPDDSVGILKHLPQDLCDASSNCFVYTAAMLGKRFLLAGLKGLKSDRDVRISHKILALNCITTIAKHQDLSRVTLLFGDFEQNLSEVSRFVLHDDDQLCASTVAFLFGLDRWNMMKTAIKEEWQERCLIAYFDLLFSDDQKVAQAALAGVEQLVRNADFTEYSGVFAARIPDDLISLEKDSLPAVLNMPSEFRFRGEWTDFVVESNLEVILCTLMEYFAKNVHVRTAGLCATMDALLKAFPASVFPECWGCLSKQPSSSCGFLSTILELCELNLNSPQKLANGLKVTSALFAGYCESYMMNVVQEQATVDRTTLPRLPEQLLLDRLILMPLRVLNMYYSLIAEYRSVTSQSSTSLLSRPTLSPLPAKKEGLDRECETRFIFLLRAALEALGTVCEMLTFSQLRPLLQEILLYVKVTFEVCPDGCTTLLHQLFKVVFGKNTANINLDILQSMKMKDPLPPLNEAEMLYLRYANEFTLFSAFVSRKEYMDTFVLRSLGWLKTDMLSRVHNPPPNEIAPALELFEGFVTVLLQVYGAFQSIPCKRGILGVMCELPRDGIIYAMADPKKVLFEAVTTQLYDPCAGNKELLTEIALYLIVLARTNVIKYDQVSRVAVELIEKAVQSNVNEIISAVEVILLETLFVLRVDAEIIYMAFRSKSKTLFTLASQRTLLLWTLFLHASRNDENRWSSTSIDFFAAYSDYSSDCVDSALNHSVYAVVTALSCMAPAMYRPVDNIFQLLQNCLSDEKISVAVKLKRSAPLLFSILNNVAEEKLLMRAEQMIKEPLDWLVGSVYDLLMASVNLSLKSGNNIPTDYILLLLQTVVNVFKAESYPKLSAGLQVRLKELDSVSIRSLGVTQPAMLSQWLQLLTLYNEPLDKYVDLSQSTEPPHSSAIPIEISLLEFCKSVFSGSLWCGNPIVFDMLLSLESQDIYYVYECVAEDQRFAFLGNLLKSVSDNLTAQMVYPDAYKTASTKAKEILDIVYDLVEFESAADANALRLKLFVLSRIPLLNSNDLVWGNFTSNEVVAFLDFAANEIILPMCNLQATCDGLAFMMGHPSTKELFIRDIFFGIQNVRKLVVSILKLMEEKNPARFEHLSATDKISVAASSDAVYSPDFDDFGGLDGFMVTLFNEVHNICHIYRSHCRKDLEHLEKLCRALFRHPVLHQFAIVPFTALKLGWISRQQFEDFWMSLFGVLSSTPTGSELTSENSANLTEQILSSSVAVSVLTDILLYSLLYPEPGNPSIGRFIIKHRERNDAFYQSKSMQLLCVLKARLTGDREPQQVYRRNLERLNYKGDVYGFGQLSALSLWTLTGVLSDENPQQLTKADSPRMRVSLSEFILKTTCELDTASSVRALFENFSHWFARGLDHLPLPLLSSTVRSMALLSDLFDDSASYEFLYLQMRNVFRGGYLDHHSDIGYVIYSMLKAVTVIGLDTASRGMTEADLAKQILVWIEYGLTSHSPFVREATLHGFIYLMQSMTLDPLKPVVQYVTAFLLEETGRQLSVTDPINVCDMLSSLEYSNLIWSVSFRIMEEPLQVSFKNTLIQVGIYAK